MGTTVQTPNSSVKSSSPMEDDSFYFSRGRRDANCKCKTCVASINATLDLMPMSAHRSSLTKLSSSKPSPPQTPLFSNPSTISTPISETSRLMVSPPLGSAIRTSFRQKINSKKTKFAYGLAMMKCVIILFLIVIMKLGFSFFTSGVMKPKLSPEIVRDLSEMSSGIQDVKEGFKFLNNELHNLVGDSVQKASSTYPKWEIVQDGLILRSRCQLYKSWMEEVSIWGWPLHSAGLLTSEFASRSFTVLSGTVTECSNGESSCSIRKANTSWEQANWSTSLWRLDQNTWILEYKRSFIFEKTTPFSSALEFFKFMMMKAIQCMKQLQKISHGNNHLTPT
ncbi:hypothetical protein L1887_04636 [Cichorium endivia]|nr:hypothetical protein L1887_04636 [Cichorium endivia]